MKKIPGILAIGLVLLVPSPGFASDKPAVPPERFFRLIDMFELETASDPQISPDGTKVVFVRNFSDIMKDKKRSNLWIVDFDGNDLRPLTTGNANDLSPRWSLDGRRLLYASSAEGSVPIFVRWLDTGQTAKVTSVQKSPTSMTWSPDGRWIAFAMLVPEETKPFAEMPAKPEGADWGKPANAFMWLASLGIGLLDGAERTRTNLEGRLPDLMRDAGLADVAETEQWATLFGTLSLYRATRA